MKGLRRTTLRARITGCLMFAVMTAITASCAVPAFMATAEATGSYGAGAGAAAGVCIVLAGVFYCADALRRKYTTEMPVRRILAATERMMKGDFAVTLKPRHEWGKYDEFDLIAENVSRMAEELSRTETLRADFVSDVSHEIKTPVAVIRNYAAALAGGGLSAEERAEYTGTLLAASERLGKLVADVLKLNKLENQRLLPVGREFDLSESVTRCALGFADAMDEKGVEADFDIEENVRVVSDESLLDIIWNNLLSNAVKFTDGGGKISVRLRATERGAAVEVADTGCGMSKETGARIFEKFYQGDPSRAGEGNGLGLALVKRVIDMLGGNISVESAPGEGSKFTVEVRTAGK